MSSGKSTNLRLEVNPHRKDCFAALPSSYVESTLRRMLPGGALPTVVALRVTLMEGASTGRSRGTSYVGALTLLPNKDSDTLLVGPSLLQVLEASPGAIVTVEPLRGDAVRDAHSVFVEPESVDDSEIVEHNQRRIENILLQQLRVVFEGLVVSVPVHRGVNVRLVFGKVNFAGSSTGSAKAPLCAMLSEGTELYVSTRTRKAQGSSSSAAPPVASLVTVSPPQQSRDTTGANGRSSSTGIGNNLKLKVTQLLAEERNWTEGLSVGVLPLATAAEAMLEQKNPTPQGAPEVFSILNPTLLRKAVKTTVEIADMSLGKKHCDFGSFAGPAFVFPDPPPQVGEVTPADMQGWGTSDFSSQLYKPICSPSVMDKVYGKSFLEEVAAHCTNQLGQQTMDAAVHLLVTGTRGCGKTSAVRYAVSRAIRDLPSCQSLYFDCSGRSADSDTMQTLRQVFYAALLSPPSVVVLDNLHAMFPADAEGQAASKNAAKSAVTTVRELLAMCASCRNMVTGGRYPVVVVATVSSKDGLHEQLRDSPLLFGRILAVPSLTHATKAALVAYLVGGDEHESTLTTRHHTSFRRVALKMDNYVCHDVVKVCQRALKGENPSEVEPQIIEQRLVDVLNNYSPLAHQGIHFLNKGDGDEDGDGPRTWDDVGALEDAKKAVYEALVLPTKFPQLFASLPLKTRSGVLLYGPPGCGKTYILSAAVAAFKLNCIVVNGPEILDKYIGASEQKVRDVFERAQAAAPCVLFFDEFDSIAPQRGHDNTGVTDRVVNQLLCYLDGVEGRSNVFVVAASSRPDLIDAALLRPGRLDKAVYCPIPTRDERAEILAVHSKKLVRDASVDMNAIAEQTEGWTAADLAGLVSTVNVRLVSRQVEARTKEAEAEGTSPLKASAEEEEHFHFPVVAPSSALARKTRENLQEMQDVLMARLHLKKKPRSTAKSVQKAKEISEVAAKATNTVSSATAGDFDEAVGETRPSISQKELNMYRGIYAKFQQSQDPTTKGHREVDPSMYQQRTTMA